ncbi:MAG TPA: SPOR domain-containing protein [Candidatus Binatus sp.]|uniref:SPOR domain-containing protein n=1 Tax=Candidatus Binatus sp. TaxID=2811406 RepID=UPI002F401922
MRFEIRAGGGFLILAGLVGLSGAVFALGLVAGYEMARQNQPDSSQISSTYPLPNPPEKPAPVSEMSPAAAASPALASVPPHEALIKPPARAIGEMPPGARPSPAAVARLKPPAEAPAANPPASDEDSDDDSETASAPAAPPRALPPGAKPYNIQIEAVMDKSGADEMVARLKSLGYNAQEMKVALNGQTWYRVRVGPYASADEATAAQDRLREQYKQAYTTSH